MCIRISLYNWGVYFLISNVFKCINVYSFQFHCFLLGMSNKLKELASSVTIVHSFWCSHTCQWHWSLPCFWKVITSLPNICMFLVFSLIFTLNSMIGLSVTNCDVISLSIFDEYHMWSLTEIIVAGGWCNIYIKFWIVMHGNFTPVLLKNCVKVQAKL